jgi:ribosome-binding factor A
MANDYSASNRLEKRIQRIISHNLIHNIKDNRLKDVSINDVQLTKDLSIAKVFCSTLVQEKSNKHLEKLLSKASGFFKKEIGKSLNIKKIPDLHFIIDNHEEYANRINQLIEDAVKNDKK